MELKPGYKLTEVGVIPEDWKIQCLGDVAHIVGGGAFKSKDVQKVGVRWLKIANVGINEILWKEEAFLPEEFSRIHSQFLLNPDDYVIALTRPILNSFLKIAKISFHEQV